MGGGAERSDALGEEVRYSERCETQGESVKRLLDLSKSYKVSVVVSALTK